MSWGERPTERRRRRGARGAADAPAEPGLRRAAAVSPRAEGGAAAPPHPSQCARAALTLCGLRLRERPSAGPAASHRRTPRCSRSGACCHRAWATATPRTGPWAALHNGCTRTSPRRPTLSERVGGSHALRTRFCSAPPSGCCSSQGRPRRALPISSARGGFGLSDPKTGTSCLAPTAERLLRLMNSNTKNRAQH